MASVHRADIAILGAGFAGSITALVLQKIGRHPVLLDRGHHPRFAIGESSTPLANLALEQLSRDYDLPRLFPFTEYGRWQQAYPEIAVGLKRGFTFYQHEPGQPFQPTPDHANEMLVAASPANEVGDTHWLREQFDHFLVREVEAAGIPYYDDTDVTALIHDDGWHLRGSRHGEEVAIDATFVVDATGPASVLARTLGIPTDPVGLLTNSWSVYSHFTDVERWEDVLGELNGSTADHPYHCDDAALHHVLADGWIWVLRFNNGVTSAGVALDGQRHPPDSSLSAEAVWQNVLDTYPGVARQFARARAIRPWVRTGRLQRRARQVAGPDWVMMPHAAYFFDALFSAGIAHTMVGIQRLARILESPRSPTALAEQLAGYERALFREVEFLDWLVHGCYRTFGRFELLAPYSMYYFTGAEHSEKRRRSGVDIVAEGFLFSHQPEFRAAVKNAHATLTALPDAAPPDPGFAAAFERRVAEDIRPFNLGGFCDPAKRNMYPFV
jgi:FADH2 O2-dependent halogenase